jgi:hypothetical protein
VLLYSLLFVASFNQENIMQCFVVQRLGIKTYYLTSTVLFAFDKRKIRNEESCLKTSKRMLGNRKKGAKMNSAG